MAENKGRQGEEKDTAREQDSRVPDPAIAATSPAAVAAASDVPIPAPPVPPANPQQAAADAAKARDEAIAEQTALRERQFAAVGEARARRAELIAERDRIQGRIDDLDRLVGDPALALAPSHLEVMVDTWGVAGRFNHGDILTMEEAELSGYDVEHAVRTGAVRPLDAGEARLLKARPMVSATQPLTPAGTVDITAASNARLAAGMALTRAEAEMQAAEMAVRPAEAPPKPEMGAE